MKKIFGWSVAGLLLCLLFCPLNAGAVKTYYSDGTVDNSSGTPSRELAFSDFEITPDGYVTGFIVNKSNHALNAVKLDMWTANKAETQILWRKSLNIGDIAAGGRYEIKEQYRPLPDDPAAVVFKFRIPSGSNFRNSQK